MSILRRAVYAIVRTVRSEPLRKVPDGFVVLVDTREQSPLFLGARLYNGERCVVNGVPFEGATLHDGDYTVRGMENVVAVERKMLSDFDAYIGKERNAKTLPKLKRLSEMKWASLVVEVSERELFGKRKYGKITGAHARGFLCKVECEYGIHTYINAQRTAVEQYVIDRLLYAWKKWGKR